jgi:diguanylate cyclase (GGDEF)-like protein
MRQATPLTARALQHALALTRAPTEEALSSCARHAAAEITALTPDPEPLLSLLSAHEDACRERLAVLADLREQASADPLTGLGHHRPLAERLASGRLTGTALLVMDIDRFKSVNDTHGHQVGDRTLVQLATALRAALHPGEELYRVGGDEFVALVEVAAPDAAAQVGRRLADAARLTGVTVSVGVAISVGDEPASALLNRADAALYGAKRSGRDTVHVAAAG